MEIQFRNQLAKKYCLEEVIGEGTFGVVFKAINLIENRPVAIKLFKDHKFSNGMSTTTVRQLRVLAFFQHHPHPNIMVPSKLLKSDEFIAVQMEFCPRTLSNHMSKYPHDPVASMKLIKSINEGLNHIHKNNYIHRDLKPSNILLDSNSKPIITDYGLVKKLHFLKNMELTDNPGTIFYRAPQQFSKLDYGQPVDMWALGVICLQLFSPAQITQEKQHQWILRVSTMFFQGKIVPVTQEYFSILEDAYNNMKPFQLNTFLLENLLKVVPAERITSKQLVQVINKFI